MSDKKKETISDIVREMRVYAKKSKINGGEIDVWNWLAHFADRIEAAHKRERETGAEAAQICGEIGEMIGREAAGRQPVTDCNRLGNTAKMREALSDACYAMFSFLKTQNGGYEEMAKALDKAKAALADPPRNCDVGTAEEQYARFLRFCDKYEGCEGCPLYKSVFPKCYVHWVQMPYEEGDMK